MAIVESISAERLFESDYGASESAVRDFILENEAPEGLGWGVSGIPAKGDPHPTRPSLVAAFLTVQNFGDDKSSRARVVYVSGDHRYTGSPSPLGPNSGSFNVDALFETSHVPMPVARLERSVDDSTGAIANVWRTEKDGFPEFDNTFTVYQVRWDFSIAEPSDWYAAFQLFSNQSGVLHDPFGQLLLFRVQSIVQLGNREIPGTGLEFRVTATWTLDPGTIAVASADPSAMKGPVELAGDGLFTPGSVPLDPGYMRNPFHTYDVIESTDPLETPAKIVHKLAYHVDADGYKSLPGVPFP